MRSVIRRGQTCLILAILVTGFDVQAKEVKKAVKLYEAPRNKRQVTETTLTISCKTKDGKIVAPSTLTYKQESKEEGGDCCTISPASGTASETGVWKVTFKFKSAGKCKITFECGGTDNLVLTVESFAAPKNPITGEDQEDEADDGKKDDPADGGGKAKSRSVPPVSDEFAKMVETQNAQVEAFLAILTGLPDPGADRPPARLIDLLLAPSPLLDLNPEPILRAVEELNALMETDPILADMLPATDVALDLYSEAVTRYFQSGDCNGNGIADHEDLANGVSIDADADFVLDECDCGKVVFDADGDRDVDQSDFGLFQACMTGAGVPPDVFNALPFTCRCMDVVVGDSDPDGAIDQQDMKVFLSCVTGPAVDVDSLGTRCDGR